jgi:hypothetical protein
VSARLGSGATTAPERLRGVLLRAVIALLFVGGIAVGGRVQLGTTTTPAPASVHTSAWLALPDGGGVVTPVTAAPASTVPPSRPSPTAPAPVAERPAAAAANTTSTDPPNPADRVTQALARIAYPWQRLGYRIVFMGPQPGIWGRTSPRSLATIEVYVRPDESVDMLAHVLAHEIGHAVDLVYNNDQRRSVWLQVRGISPRPWFTCSMCQDFSTPAGDFAETFSFWQLHDFSRSQLAPAPSPAELNQLSALFAPPPS